MLALGNVMDAVSNGIDAVNTPANILFRLIRLHTLANILFPKNRQIHIIDWDYCACLASNGGGLHIISLKLESKCPWAQW